MSVAVLADARWIGPHGIGRFAAEVLARLPGHERLEAGPRPLSLRDPLWTAWQVCRRRPAVYFSPGFNPPPLCAAPLVFTMHDLTQIREPEVATPAKRAYYAAVLRPACHRAFRVLTVSEYSRREIVRWSGLAEGRIVNVGNGVGAPFGPDGERYAPGFRYVLYAGNFRRHKNLERLFAAFRGLTDRDVRLLLTGTAEPEVLRAAAAHGAMGRTLFAGRLTDAELARAYRGAAAVVQPSLAEGFGLTALEALACGAPLVASRAGALPEVVGEAAVLVDPLDIADIRRGIERALTAGRALRAAGLERARRFTWDGVAARVRAVLREAAP